METPQPWFRRRFGSHLQRYDSVARAAVAEPVENVFKRVECDGGGMLVVGVYLVPLPDAGMRYANEDCGRQLRRLYDQLAANMSDRDRDDGDACPKLQVVQVCFPHRPPTINFTLDHSVKNEYENRFTNVPWFALPFDCIERSIRLRHHYGVRDGEFAFVLLDGDTGQVITNRGHERLLQDEHGLEFPWTPPNVVRILQNVPEYFSYRREDFVESNRDDSPPLRTSRSFKDIDKDSILGLYFSAHWCPPCKAFTSQLIKTYASIKESGRKFEIIFVSSDRSADSYGHYVSTMPWLAIPYENDATRAHLTNLYGIRGIPSLILLNADGSVITEDGRGQISDDPRATNFPWYPKSVELLTPRIAAKMQRNPAVVLFIDGEADGEIELATAVLAPISQRVQDENRDESLLFMIATDSDTGESIREFLRLEDVSPLLTLVDISLGRYAVMEYGKEITERAIMNFVKRFYDNELVFLPIECNV